MLVSLCVALWSILRGDLFFVLPCVILFLRFSVLLGLRLPRLGKRELILVLFVHLIDFYLFGICRFPLPLGVWEGRRFVIVLLPGLFSYLVLEAFMRTEFLCISVLRVASRPRVKFASCRSALTSPAAPSPPR